MMAKILSTMEPLSWAAGIASLGVALIALLLQIASKNRKSRKVREESQTSVSQAATSNSTQIGVIQGDYHINIHSTATHAAKEKIDVPGRWDLKVARELANKQLALNWKFVASNMEEPITHGFVDDYSLIYGSKEGIVLIFSSITEGLDCHACAPYLSFFEFEKHEAGWKLTTSDIGVCIAGSWGKPPVLSASVVGENKYGVFMQDCYMAQGWSVCATSIHTRIGDTFKEVLKIITSQSDPDGRGWNSKIELRPTPTGLFDIEFHRWGEHGAVDLVFMEGNPEMRPDVSEHDGRIRSEDVFKFDGKRYRRTAITT